MRYVVIIEIVWITVTNMLPRGEKKALIINQDIISSFHWLLIKFGLSSLHILCQYACSPSVPLQTQGSVSE